MDLGWSELIEKEWFKEMIKIYYNYEQVEIQLWRCLNNFYANKVCVFLGCKQKKIWVWDLTKDYLKHEVLSLRFNTEEEILKDMLIW